MQVVIPREFEPFVARVVENGEFRDESAVVREAPRLLENREQFRAAAGGRRATRPRRIHRIR